VFIVRVFLCAYTCEAVNLRDGGQVKAQERLNAEKVHLRVFLLCEYAHVERVPASVCPLCVCVSSGTECLRHVTRVNRALRHTHQNTQTRIYTDLYTHVHRLLLSAKSYKQHKRSLRRCVHALRAPTQTSIQSCLTSTTGWQNRRPSCACVR
jgi:hypothetical protein